MSKKSSCLWNRLWRKTWMPIKLYETLQRVSLRLPKSNVFALFLVNWKTWKFASKVFPQNKSVIYTVVNLFLWNCFTKLVYENRLMSRSTISQVIRDRSDEKCGTKSHLRRIFVHKRYFVHKRLFVHKRDRPSPVYETFFRGWTMRKNCKIIREHRIN